MRLIKEMFSLNKIMLPLRKAKHAEESEFEEKNAIVEKRP